METKDTVFAPNSTLNMGGQLLEISSPIVMGIINASGDSFYKPGDHSMPALLQRAGQMLEQGAAILDVGAMSSRPGARSIPQEEEISRLIPLLKAIKKEYPAAHLSVDTYRSETVRRAADEGVAMVNDISAGSLDAALWDTVAELRMPYVLMHMQGTPDIMQKDPQYNNVLKELLEFFQEKLLKLRELGVKDILIDPGFGFGKTLAHNYSLLRNLDYFNILDLPLLVGISRKSMVSRALGVPPEDALNGTTALHALALVKGAKLLRVHDVPEAMEVISLIKHYDDAAAI